MGSNKKREKSNAPSERKAATSRQTSETKSSLALGPFGSLKRVFLILLLAYVFALLHTYHVSTLFENDRHFSHLSTLEREMTFRSEMGLYYSYFKTIVEAPTFFDGFNQITRNNLTEYPSVINTLERFNLLPEVVLGCLYRIFDKFCDYFHIEGKVCWEIERGNGFPPVHSCEGIRQPEYFYLEAVWFCAGLTASFIFLFGVVLSGSILGGIISGLCFFYNHSEATRVQWSPPLRESFAYPFCLLQMLCVTLCLQANKNTDDSSKRTKTHTAQFVVLMMVTSFCLSMWQFSQFLFATQIIAVLLLFMFGFVSEFSAVIIFAAEMVAVVETLIFMFGNELLMSSFYNCLLISSCIIVTFLYPVLNFSPGSTLKNFCTSIVIFAVAILLKTRVFISNDDAHIVNIIRSKFTSYKDFHTLLYTCAAEFDFLGWSTIVELTKTLLLPTAIFSLFVLFLHWLVSSSKLKALDPSILYNILQLGAFAVMAGLIMRLKLFFTPHLCIIASIIASRTYFKVLPAKYHYPLLVVLVGCMHINGMANIKAQHKIIGEYSNFSLEELLTWINQSTSPKASFAGPMPIMASIMLSTRRPIVNHPHYEDAKLRDRTKKVYSAFSRKPLEEVFKLISSLEADYLVLGDDWCYHQASEGCSMIDLWDVEDPANRGRAPTCTQILLGNFPFHLVFSNDRFTVLKLQPPYVELKGFNKY
ncbi:Q-cell neuroblast polarisation [Nesidiocoris tenuis]|uniref:Q-cell neuroblast polarisation n=1 Tax=Nesidiocoris tenuis TaxID=355587 RepID=A0ABN7A6M5_9HEMI|nr:Q-cell neuroblast polarisation [Nesidiocoris tenuis]